MLSTRVGGKGRALGFLVLVAQGVSFRSAVCELYRSCIPSRSTQRGYHCEAILWRDDEHEKATASRARNLTSKRTVGECHLA
jgi:hypothetical protein